MPGPPWNFFIPGGPLDCGGLPRAAAFLPRARQSGCVQPLQAEAHPLPGRICPLAKKPLPETLCKEPFRIFCTLRREYGANVLSRGPIRPHRTGFLPLCVRSLAWKVSDRQRRTGPKGRLVFDRKWSGGGASPRIRPAMALCYPIWISQEAFNPPMEAVNTTRPASSPART